MIPFWNDAAPDGQKNSAEWFANVYSAGRNGNLCFNLYAGPNTSAPLDQTCGALGSSWNGAIPNLTVCPAVCLNDLWQVEGHGPNGGFTPFYYGNKPDLYDRVGLHPRRAGLAREGHNDLHDAQRSRSRP